jgi:hypothetical protein
MAIGFQALVSASHKCFNLVIPLFAKGLPSFLLLALSGLPLKFKIWRFPNMGYLKIFAKEEGSSLSNLPLIFIHTLKIPFHKE